MSVFLIYEMEALLVSFIIIFYVVNKIYQND